MQGAGRTDVLRWASSARKPRKVPFERSRWLYPKSRALHSTTVHGIGFGLFIGVPPGSLQDRRKMA